LRAISSFGAQLRVQSRNNLSTKAEFYQLVIIMFILLLCHQDMVCALDNNRTTKSEHLFINFNIICELYRGLMLTNYFRGIVNYIK